MMIKIKHRHTGAILFECEAQNMRDAVEHAVKTGANLARADLARANLANADMANANLANADMANANMAEANLANANMAGAYLAGARLAGTNLAFANLAEAYLASANMARTNLAGSNMTGAYLALADLAGSYLADANMANADMAHANLSGAKWRDDVIINRTPLQVHGLRWAVTILDQHMQIGCQLHTLAEWAAFDDKEIIAMDGRDALRFWRANKTALLALAHADGRGAA